MSTQTATIPYPQGVSPAASVLSRSGLFVLFTIVGVAIFVFGSNYFVIFPTNQNLTYNLAVSAALLAAAAYFKRNARLNRYWRIAYAFFVGSVAFPLTLALGGWSASLLNWLKLTPTTAQGIAVAKVNEMAIVCLALIALTKLSGADLDSIFIRRGSLKWGLGIGTVVLFNLVTSAFLFFAARYTEADKLAAAATGALAFSFANGFMEELWLRGIFLKPLQPLLGTGGAIWLTSLVFALMHTGGVYVIPAAIPFMLLNALTLGLACGYLMVKTNSVWGPTLIHAGADYFLFIAMLAPA